MGIPSTVPNVLGNSSLESFDMLIIGSGAGGASAAYVLTAAGLRVLEVRAVVVGLDRAARSLDVKAANGRVTTLIAGDEVKNYDQIQLGDNVVARFMQALTLELKKGGSGIMERTDAKDAVAAKPGERPGVAAARQIHVIANVVEVNKKTMTVTLKGPKGNFVFNASTIFWSQGLSAPPGHMPPISHHGRPHGPDERVQRMTRNVLEKMRG